MTQGPSFIFFIGKRGERVKLKAKDIVLTAVFLLAAVAALFLILWPEGETPERSLPLTNETETRQPAEPDTVTVDEPEESETEAPETEPPETEPADSEPEETEPEETEAEETEPEEIHIPELSVRTETIRQTAEFEGLETLLRWSAPLRWIADPSSYVQQAPETADGEDAAGPAQEDRFIQVPAKVSYLYYNLITGEEIGFRADEVRYAASLVKVPFIYSLLREIEAFEADPANRDEFGTLIYEGENRKYDLSEEWTYDPLTMEVEGSGKIFEEEEPPTLTWEELIQYAILYSDNVAVDQLRQRFGYASYNSLLWRLGVQGIATGDMNLSPHDCMLILREVYDWFEGGSKYALMMKDCMIHSKYPEMIQCHYPTTTVCHKYGWDIDAYHDMAIVYDEVPYLIVIMTDYDDGDVTARNYFAGLVWETQKIHRKICEENPAERE